MDAPVTGQLRILQTTDLHMQLLPFDYFSQRIDPATGLVSLADQIMALKSDKTTTILCDNGDLIQGSPLADYLAKHLSAGAPHPMLQALNLLGYDAMTIGNHDFDFGLDVLRNALRTARFPVVSANLSAVEGPALCLPYAIIERQIVCDDGLSRPIRIGVTGFGPPQSQDWGDKTGKGGILAGDIIEAANRIVPQIRDAGADLIIALCHSGIGAAAPTPRMENAAVPLASVDGIDVILAGHTHEAFPNLTQAATKEIDPLAGTLHGKPAVMATFSGKTLGVIDLDLSWNEKGWAVCGHRVRLEPAVVTPNTQSPVGQQLRSLIAAAHTATLAKMSAPIAHTAVPIHSYFATVQPDLSQELLALAMQDTLAAAIDGTPEADLPVLAATSPFRSGGRGGMGHYIDIAPGPITLRDAAAIFPFADTVCGVRRTGAQLATWLERAASYYYQITAGQRDQPLLNPLNPGYNCDTIFGLSYEIDLTQPARFDMDGSEINPRSRRIHNLSYHDKPVADTDTFVIATTSYRCKGGGGFPALPHSDILHVMHQPIREMLVAHLRDSAEVKGPGQPTWSFCKIPQTAATFQSAPAAQAHLAGPITYIGAGADGFDTYQISF